MIKLFSTELPSGFVQNGNMLFAIVRCNVLDFLETAVIQCFRTIKQNEKKNVEVK